MYFLVLCSDPVMASKTRVFIFLWGTLILSALLVKVSALPPEHCDELNCYVNLSEENVRDWTEEQLKAATPSKLLELDINVKSNFNLISSECKDPVQLNAISCMEQGLPCASMGKEYFTSIYTGPSSCSGSFITDNVVLTAGHCCMEKPGAWSYDMDFFLDYDHGQDTGHYLPTELIVPQPWYESSDRRYDWCFMKMNGTAPKHLKTTWSFDPSQFDDGFSAYGWPALAPYDGSSLYQAPGQCRGTSPNWPPSQYDPCNQIPSDGNSGMIYMICNTMTPGCSGGAWYDSAIGVFGLNSALINAPDEPTIYVSPYFGKDFYASCKQAGVCN